MGASKNQATPRPAAPSSGSRVPAPPAPTAQRLAGLDYPHLVMGFMPYQSGGAALVRRDDVADERKRYGVLDVSADGSTRLCYDGTLGGPWVSIGAAGARWIGKCDPQARTFYFVAE